MTTIEIMFWVCVALIVYAYAIYPIVVWGLSRLFGRLATSPALAEDDLPSVSLLIAAYNEEQVIAPRIENALALDYPADRLEVVIASDGSNDATARIVSAFEDRRIRLLQSPLRRGKATVLNAAFRHVRGDIVLLSDANTFTDRSALRHIVRWFENPRVGIVCGHLVLTDPATGRNVDGLYWRYETFLKTCEGRLGALLGANGAIYAIRRSSFAGIWNDTIVDDFVIPLVTRLRSGCEIVYDDHAIAYEETPHDFSTEFSRRSRIGAGGFQSIIRLRGLLNPGQGWTAFTFFSHKVLRWLCPFLLIARLRHQSRAHQRSALSTDHDCAGPRIWTGTPRPGHRHTSRVQAAAPGNDVHRHERGAARRLLALGVGWPAGRLAADGEVA